MKVSEAHVKGVAFGLTLGVVYIVCAAFFVLFPGAAFAFFRALFHGVDVVKLGAPQLSAGWMVLGLVEIIIVGYLIGFMNEKFRNLCWLHCKAKGWIK